MKLDLQQLRDIAWGAEQITQEDSAFWFNRFTEEETQLYLAKPDLYIRAKTPAGVNLEFTTDAKQLFLQVTNPVKPNYHSFFAFDILVDGVLVGQLKNFTGQPESGKYYDAIVPTDRPSATFDLGEGVKKVQIVFPWSVKIGVETLELTDATFVTPVKRDKRYLIYGDSITHGSCSLYPSRSYAALMTQWLGAEAINKAVGCEIYFPPLAEAARWESPDYITVAYGCNDWCNCTREEFAENCRAFWKAICAKYPNAKKFALAPIWYPDQSEEKPFGPLEDVEKIMCSVLSDFPEVTVIDCMDFISRDPIHYGDGWIHPGHTGFQMYFESLKKALTPYL